MTEKKAASDKLWRIANKDYLAEKKKEWALNNKEKIRSWHQSPIGKYKAYRDSAKARKLDFNITLEEFSTFWQNDCSYCGSAITTIGLDRVDSSVGYNLDNVVACCSRCNEMKMDATKEAWFDKMFTILKKQGVI